MAFSKRPSQDSVIGGALRKALGDDNYTVARAEEVVRSLLKLSVEALVHANPQVFAVPYAPSIVRYHLDALSAEQSRDSLLSSATAPQGRSAATSSPDATAEVRRLLAELRQELQEGNEDARQDVRRHGQVLASLNVFRDTIRDFGLLQIGVRSVAEGAQNRGSGLPYGEPSGAASDPRQQAVPAATTSSVASASDRPPSASFRDELYEARRQAVEARACHTQRKLLIDDIERTLNCIQSIFGAISATGRPVASPCSQSWMPKNLAMAVSRVYYYSSDYAEELISAPLKVSGYTVRLAVLCRAADSCVKLLFRAQFCFDSGNDVVQWPFRGAVQLVIHHPRNRASNRVYTVQPSQDIETLMPRNVHNAFFYLAGPISALRLDQSGFWAMETLHLSVKVVPGPDSGADS